VSSFNLGRSVETTLSPLSFISVEEQNNVCLRRISMYHHCN